MLNDFTFLVKIISSYGVATNSISFTCLQSFVSLHFSISHLTNWIVRFWWFLSPIFKKIIRHQCFGTFYINIQLLAFPLSQIHIYTPPLYSRWWKELDAYPSCHEWTSLNPPASESDLTNTVQVVVLDPMMKQFLA